jgi:hypothetical protein
VVSTCLLSTQHFLSPTFPLYDELLASHITAETTAALPASMEAAPYYQDYEMASQSTITSAISSFRRTLILEFLIWYGGLVLVNFLDGSLIDQYDRISKA